MDAKKVSTVDFRVVVSSHGRYHLFDLTRYLLRKNLLAALYTAYPRFKVDQDLQSYAHTHGWLTMLRMGLLRAGLTSQAQALGYAFHVDFDRFVAQNLQQGDLLMALDGGYLKTYERALDLGMKIVCDRGSSHPVAQEQLLIEEYARFGIPYHTVSKRGTTRQLAEYELADLITVPSSFALRSFVDQGISPMKIRQVPYGVDLSLFRPLPKEDKVFRVLFVGTKTLRKGLLYLLEALASLKLSNFELVLIGSEADRQMKDLMGQYASSFRDLGFVHRTKLAYHYSQGSVLVMPSIEEGLSLVQAQAMACGLPIIATTNTGAEDLFTNGVEGFVVPIRDQQAIREKVLYLYENNDIREQMGQAALHRVQFLGGWDDYGAKMVAVYEELLSA